jgi:hypothetical protein
MKINKYWYMDIYGCSYTLDDDTDDFATQEEFDKVAIYHKPKDKDHDFGPIIFSDDCVASEDTWDIPKFYRGIVECIKAYKWESHDKNVGYSIEKVSITMWGKRKYHIQWGCRHFKIRDLNAIKKLMEELYTAKELGND